mmetsp:Transcript_89814/g.290203  ORF Transcript_89814/g.290203 Transcript_89814/m.290203 type:complete len:200 (-) Transcript_89814:251-850(-)
MRNLEASRVDRLHGLQVAGVAALVVDRVELHDDFLELFQRSPRIGRENEPLGALDVHLHQQAPVRRIALAGLLQSLLEVPIRFAADAARTPRRGEARLEKVAVGALLGRVVHGAIELVHRHLQGLVDVVRPLVVALDAHGVGGLDLAALEAVLAGQVAAVVTLAPALELMALRADPEAVEQALRRALGKRRGHLHQPRR